MGEGVGGWVSERVNKILFLYLVKELDAESSKVIMRPLYCLACDKPK